MGERREKEKKLFSGYGGHDDDLKASNTPDSVKVAIRLRKLDPADFDAQDASREFVHAIDETSTIRTADGRKYYFDYVFGPSSTQQRVYECTAQPLLNWFVDGYNCTILAYGQTGSGKTFTMGTDAQDLEKADPLDIGILPRLMGDLFMNLEVKQKNEARKGGKRGGYKSEIWCQFLEIYNKEIRDLLADTRTKKKPTKIELRERGGQVVVVGAKEAPVMDMIGLLDFFSLGCNARTTGATDMNKRSSRSHAIFTLCLKQEVINEDGTTTRLTSKLNLVDLAGSERQKKTNAKGVRLTESMNINMGLLALGNVISALGDKTQEGAHVPYRQSLITRLLQDSLGGNSQTLMIACCSPAASNRDETLNTLKYANRARNIQNAPLRVVSLTNEEIVQLQRELESMVHQTLKQGYCDESPEGVITRLDAQSLFQAMVLIAHRIQNNRTKEESAAAQKDQADAMTSTTPVVDATAEGPLYEKPADAAATATGTHVGGGDDADDGCGDEDADGDHADIRGMERELGGVYAMENSLIALESEHAKLIECVAATSEALRVVIEVLADRSKDGRLTAMQRIAGIAESLELLIGIDGSVAGAKSAPGSMRSGVESADASVRVGRVPGGGSGKIPSHKEQTALDHEVSKVRSFGCGLSRPPSIGLRESQSLAAAPSTSNGASRNLNGSRASSAREEKVERTRDDSGQAMRDKGRDAVHGAARDGNSGRSGDRDCVAATASARADRTTSARADRHNGARADRSRSSRTDRGNSKRHSNASTRRTDKAALHTSSKRSQEKASKSSRLKTNNSALHTRGDGRKGSGHVGDRLLNSFKSLFSSLRSPTKDRSYESKVGTPGHSPVKQRLEPTSVPSAEHGIGIADATHPSALVARPISPTASSLGPVAEDTCPFTQSGAARGTYHWQNDDASAHSAGAAASLPYLGHSSASATAKLDNSGLDGVYLQDIAQKAAAAAAWPRNAEAARASWRLGDSMAAQESARPSASTALAPEQHGSVLAGRLRSWASYGASPAAEAHTSYLPARSDSGSCPPDDRSERFDTAARNAGATAYLADPRTQAAGPEPGLHSLHAHAIVPGSDADDFVGLETPLAGRRGEFRQDQPSGADVAAQRRREQRSDESAALTLPLPPAPTVLDLVASKRSCEAAAAATVAADASVCVQQTPSHAAPVHQQPDMRSVFDDSLLNRKRSSRAALQTRKDGRVATRSGGCCVGPSVVS